MCGIAGFISPQDQKGTNHATVNRMVDKIRHRGPDRQSAWVDDEIGIALGHSRLSILDLSTFGDQPMVSPSGQFVIVYNGEIYNHLELRKQLPSIDWQGTSDTETLVSAIDVWGLENTVKKLVGMFAFALFDRKSKKLFLVRDRFGEKPLYYGWQNGSFLFASDLKALAPHPSWQPELCQNALGLYTRFGYVPTPWTIWKDVFKLPPGSWIQYALQAPTRDKPEPYPYWRTSSKWEPTRQSSLCDHDAIEQVEDTLRAAVSDQMLADVPVGVFLSGGIDSSLITALMQSLSGNQVNSFSIGFNENDFDEAPYAKAIANHLGTAHTEYYLSSQETLDVIPYLANMYSEPFADSSQIPTYLVSALAKRDVTVCLSGDAGDELFGGYNRYQWGPRVWRSGQTLPKLFRSSLGIALQSLSPAILNNLTRFLPRQLAFPVMGDQLQKIAFIMNCADLDKVYETLVSIDLKSEQSVMNAQPLSTWADSEYLHFSKFDRQTEPVHNMMFRDIVGYLCDDILTKVDRASMATSLETRIPMLDHRVAKLAWSLPANMKIRNGKGKWILRQILYRHVPLNLIERPKQGFAIPLNNWLRGPLQDWAEDLLNTQRLSQQGFFDTKIVQQRWHEHKSGQRNWQNWLWSILMFQQWHEKHAQ